MRYTNLSFTYFTYLQYANCHTTPRNCADVLDAEP